MEQIETKSENVTASSQQLTESSNGTAPANANASNGRSAPSKTRNQKNKGTRKAPYACAAETLDDLQTNNRTELNYDGNSGYDGCGGDLPHMAIFQSLPPYNSHNGNLTQPQQPTQPPPRYFNLSRQQSPYPINPPLPEENGCSLYYAGNQVNAISTGSGPQMYQEQRYVTRTDMANFPGYTNKDESHMNQSSLNSVGIINNAFGRDTLTTPISSSRSNSAHDSFQTPGSDQTTGEPYSNHSDSTVSDLDLAHTEAYVGLRTHHRNSPLRGASPESRHLEDHSASPLTRPDSDHRLVGPPETRISAANDLGTSTFKSVITHTTPNEGETFCNHDQRKLPEYERPERRFHHYGEEHVLNDYYGTPQDASLVVNGIARRNYEEEDDDEVGQTLCALEGLRHHCVVPMVPCVPTTDQETMAVSAAAPGYTSVIVDAQQYHVNTDYSQQL